MNKALFTMPADTLSTRLPFLDITVDANPLLASEGATPEDAKQLFQLELQRNLMDAQDTATYGSVKLQITNAAMKRTGRGFQIFQMATLMTPTLLGVPLEYFRTSLKAELQIIDVKGNVLATYAGQGASKIRVAMYHGYSQQGAPRLSDVEALRQALNQIRPQLAADAATLREQLILAKTAGTVTISDVPGATFDAPATPEPAPADSSAVAPAPNDSRDK